MTAPLPRVPCMTAYPGPSLRSPLVVVVVVVIPPYRIHHRWFLELPPPPPQQQQQQHLSSPLLPPPDRVGAGCCWPVGTAPWTGPAGASRFIHQQSQPKQRHQQKHGRPVFLNQTCTYCSIESGLAFDLHCVAKCRSFSLFIPILTFDLHCVEKSKSFSLLIPILTFDPLYLEKYVVLTFNPLYREKYCYHRIFSYSKFYNSIFLDICAH
jgi:hypothetical protein